MDASIDTVQVIVRAVEDQSGELPLNERLVRALDRLIGQELLAPGMKLPSTRELAEALTWDRSTVLQAYRKLAGTGRVESGVGRGTFVKPGGSEREAGFPWAEMYPAEDPPWDVEQILARDVPSSSGGVPIRLSGALPDPRLFPVEELREIVHEILRVNGTAALAYGPAEGLAGLREEVAVWLSRRGIPAAAEQILIVQGSQQGLDLVIRRLVRPGEIVAIESPTYTQALALLRTHGVRLAPIPLDEEGVRVDILDRVAAREPVKLLYTMPTYQNPTGLTQSLLRRRALLEVAARHGFPILEDHFDADLRYEGDAPRALKALDEREQVILLGTFSKILFPGLRIGWLLSPRPIYGSLSRLMRAAALSAGLLVQLALAEFCRRGWLEEHLERVREIYARRRRAVLQAMAESFPPEVAWTRPHGGMTLWVTLPETVDAVRLAMEARRRRVLVTPGNLYFVEGGSHHLALSSTAEPEERLREGIGILGELMARSLAGGWGQGARAPEVEPIV